MGKIERRPVRQAEHSWGWEGRQTVNLKKKKKVHETEQMRQFE